MRDFAKEVGVSKNTACLMLCKIRSATSDGFGLPKKEQHLFMSEDKLLKNLPKHCFTGIVEIDEAYLGGCNKNRHRHKRLPGRGPKGKIIVLGLKERESKRPVTIVLKKATQKQISKIIHRLVKPGSAVITDESHLYNRVKRLGYRYFRVNHSHDVYMIDYGFIKVHTNNIENLWSGLKHHYKANHIMSSRKYTQLYMDEATYMVNWWKRDKSDQDNLKHFLGRVFNGQPCPRKKLVA